MLNELWVKLKVGLYGSYMVVTILKTNQKGMVVTILKTNQKGMPF